MVERSRRGKGQNKLLGNHQRSWVWGRNLVQAILESGRWPILELHLADDLSAEQLQTAQKLSQQRQIPCVLNTRDELQRLGHTSEHQGYLARMGPYPYVTPAELLAGTSSSGNAVRPALFLVLDQIQDPYNFGAMLRSAEVLGVHGVWIGCENQVPVNSQVARSSAGGVTRLPIARVPDLASQVGALRARGMQIVGASEKAENQISDCNLKLPTAIIIGNEGRGISSELLALCDPLAGIPLQGTTGSLNAAAAAAVILYEVQRQRRSV